MSPRVLLVNDDGPPGSQSPYIYGLYRHLTTNLSELSVKPACMKTLASNLVTFNQDGM
jgi:broad specificity polyphosphatase/5'/3'-nucleotidase SurE